MNKGTLFVLSGPSGVGKGTVLDKLLNKYNNINYSVSATTRKPRPEEVDGEDYFFISREEFIEKKDKGKFIEWAKVHDNFYGTPKDYVNQCLENGEDIILEIDIQGARQVKRNYPSAVFIFLVPPSLMELEKRLNKRGSEKDSTKELRLKNAKTEIKEQIHYDYKVINDDLHTAVKRLQEIIEFEKGRDD